MSKIWWRFLVPGFVFLMTAGMALAQQQVGEIGYAQGVTTVQKPGTDARFVVQGDALFEGDLVSTAVNGYAVLELIDGTKITLRPASSFVIEKFSHGKGEENALLRLVKGGLRAMTGLVSKRNPGGVTFSTVTATIGIRGTSFDARLCEGDCRQEQRENRPRPGLSAPIPSSNAVAGRVVRITGEASASQPGQTSRRLFDGSSVMVSDEIVTGNQATVVIGFRDQSKVAIEPQSVFRVESFRFGVAGERDTFAQRLLKGGLRVFTGLIGKKTPSAVSVSTVVATIGIRGTGMDIRCEGPCAAVSQPASASCAPAKAGGKGAAPSCADGLFVHTWDGSIYVDSNNKALDVGLGQTGFVGRDRQSRLLATTPDFMTRFSAPRPDGVDVDWMMLFGGYPYIGEDGLYTLVRDGYTFLDAANGHLDLAPGEAGMVGADGRPRRLDPVPGFLRDDPFPAPEMFNINEPLILELFGATTGNPGQDICEIH